jgi:hypothetical protein
LQGEYGNATLLPYHQEDHPEGFPQRCPRLMKDNRCGERECKEKWRCMSGRKGNAELPHTWPHLSLSAVQR